MALSKKQRFEVFKRDGFKCQYCGASPPSVTLECDHIDPVSKGGTDDEENLITACFDCNRGKSNRLLSDSAPTLEHRREQMEEKESQLREFRKWKAKIRSRETKDIKELDDHFYSMTQCEFTQQFKEGSLRTMVRKLDVDELKEFLSLAVQRTSGNPERAVKYFCGCFWTRVRQLEGEQ